VLPEGCEELDDFIEGSMKGALRNKLEWQIQKLMPPSDMDEMFPDPSFLKQILYVSACLLTQVFFLMHLIFKVDLKKIE